MWFRGVLFSSLIVLGLTAASLSRLRPAVVGDLPENSQAYGWGLRSGDQIVKIGQQSIDSWESFCLEWARAHEGSVEIEVRRGNEALKITTAGTHEGPPSRFGLKPNVAPAKLALKVSSPLRIYGVVDGDEVVALNGRPIQGFEQLKGEIKNLVPDKPLNIDLIRSSDKKAYSVAVASLVEQREFSLENLGIIPPINVVEKVKWASVAAKLGLVVNDRFVLIQGQPPQSTFSVAKFNTALRIEKTLKVAVVRLDKVQHLEMKADGLNAPEQGDFSDLMNFFGITTMAQGSKADRFPTSFNDFQSALWFQLAGRE